MKRDKGKYDVEASAALLRDNSENPAGFISVVMDITERKRVEEALRASEERYRLLVDSAPDAIVVVGVDGTIHSCNLATEQITGYKSQELEGRSFLELATLDTEELARATKFFEDVMFGQALEDFEMQVKHKDGTQRWISIKVRALRSEENIIGIMVIARDITERRREQEELIRLSNAVKMSTDSIVIGDMEANIIDVNEATLKMYGTDDKGDLIGQNAFYLVDPQDRKKALASLEEVLDSGSSESGEYHIVTKDGSRVLVEMSTAIMKGADGKPTGLVAVSRDITERKRMEEALRKKKEEVEEQTKQLQAVNKELEAFSYSVSHDLRAPLRSIDGFSQVLLEDYSDKLDDQGKDYLQRVRLASQRMAGLIDDLLNLSRVTRGEMRYDIVDLSALAQQIAKELQQSQPEREVQFAIAPSLKAKGDMKLIRVVLENLLGNAWKFTRKRAHTKIEFGYAENNGQTAYFVRDNGVGFDMSYADKLFGAFQRLHSDMGFEGTGIGLATVQRIIHRHGGKIWAESAVDQGATFYFTL